MNGRNPIAGRTVEQTALVSLLDDVEGLASPPDVCLRVFELVHSPNAGAADIAEVVATDPNLTARLLRIANSAFYRFRRKIDTISRAIMVIGTTELYQLVLSVSAVKSFSGIPNELVRMETFWKHSVYTGLVARALAERASVLHPERLFVAGLLHDIGSLVLYHQRPQAMRDLLLVADGDEEVLYEAEHDRFGFSHADVAALMMDEWCLPEELVLAIKWHHQPGFAGLAALEAQLLFLAGQLVNESEQGNFMGSPRADVQVEAEMLAMAGLGEDDLFAAFEAAAEQFPSVLESLI